jgi:hypothetical protein
MMVSAEASRRHRDGGCPLSVAAVLAGGVDPEGVGQLDGGDLDAGSPVESDDGHLPVLEVGQVDDVLGAGDRGRGPAMDRSGRASCCLASGSGCSRRNLGHRGVPAGCSPSTLGSSGPHADVGRAGPRGRGGRRRTSAHRCRWLVRTIRWWWRRGSRGWWRRRYGATGHRNCCALSGMPSRQTRRPWPVPGIGQHHQVTLLGSEALHGGCWPRRRETAHSPGLPLA